jgi:predicted ATPase/DNA-binding SARP family transcriptional activator
VSPPLEFRILGPLEVRSDARTIELGSHGQRALLAALLLHADEVVPRDQLIEEVWGEGAPASAANMVQGYVSRLRKSLGPGLLLTQAPGYVLRTGDAQLDAARFSGLVADAGDAVSAGRAAAARELLAEALELWRGPALADFTYESFAQGEVARLEELRLRAVELLGDADLALGRHSRLVSELEQLIVQHPFRERLRWQLMLALYRSGRQADALEAYRAARRTLVDELGIEPGPALQRLERAILAQDAELDAPADEPAAPPPSDGMPLGNVPLELTSLIGRDADVLQVTELLSRHRLVSVVGPGGVGKTRVAQRVASTAADLFPQGAWFVDLVQTGAEDDVAAAAMSAVGVSDRAGSAPLEALADQLRNRKLLLVLDNCEHVISAAAQLAARLVSECPGVRIVATSREPLAVAGERVVRLEPLSTTANGSEPSAAVALFLDRAAGHGVFGGQPETALPIIQEICARLDGIPLAIELAAARVRAISPSELLAHLGDRLQLLSGPRDWSTHARQQTLEATIAWSYELLSDDDQATLRRVSVFHGGFSLPAATAVCADIGTELDVMDRVTGLVDRSVVSRVRSGDCDRYRLLESIWLFAERRLRDQGEDGTARNRHARFFLEFAQDRADRPYGPRPAAWADRIDAEEDNVAAALAWCLDGDGDRAVGAELAAGLGFHWICRGRSNAARRWLERALQRGDEIAPAVRVALHLSYSVFTYSVGDLDASRTHAATAVALAREGHDTDLLAEALAYLALAQEGLGEHRDATAIAAELRSLQPRLASARAHVMSLLGTAQVALVAGRPKESSADTSRAQEIARHAGDHVRAALSGYWLAYALAIDWDVPSARTVIADAMDDAAASGYQLLVVDNLLASASFAFADDDLESARRAFPDAIEMLRDQQRWTDLGNSLRLAAGVELRRGFSERSALLLGAATRRSDEMDFQEKMLLPELAGLADRLSEELGSEAFMGAVERGAALDLDAVAALLASGDVSLQPSA